MNSKQQINKQSLLNYKFEINPKVLYRNSPNKPEKAIQVLDTESGDFFEIDSLAALLFCSLNDHQSAIKILREIKGSKRINQKTKNCAVIFLCDLLNANLINMVK
jgi:hypothetical protein